jgi:hypothetical protein
MKTLLGVMVAHLLATTTAAKGHGIQNQIAPPVQSPCSLKGAVPSRYAPRPNAPLRGKRRRQWR